MKSRLPAIAFRPRPSRQLALILLSFQLLACGVLIAAPIGAGAKLTLLCLALLQSYHTHRRLHGPNAGRIAEVRIEDDHSARLVFADGRIARTRLRGDSLVVPGVILLRFEGSGLRRPSLLLGRDSLSADESRRLRVLLRVGGRGEETDGRIQ